MDNFVSDYISFVSWLDPYYMDDYPEEPAEMAYNLREIKKDLDLCGDDDKDINAAKSRINILIDKYREIIGI